MRPVPQSDGRAISLWGCALGIAVFAVYANSFRIPFLFDDRSAIVENTTITDLSAIETVLFPPHTITTTGRPLLNLSFALNYALDGGNVTFYHGVNVAIHVLAALAFFGFARRTLVTSELSRYFARDATLLAAFVAALWALHPLQTASVTYVSQRAESLMGLCYLSALYFFSRSTTAVHRSLWLGLSITACACGMATKEVMITAPIVVLGYDCVFVSGSIRAAFTQRWGYYFFLAATWLILVGLMLKSRLLGSHGLGYEDPGVSNLTYAATETWVIASYFRLAWWPNPLVFDYGFQLYARHIWEHWLPLLGELAAVVIIVLAWRKAKPVALAGGTFLLMLAPTSSLIPIPLQPMAENRMYLPLGTLVILFCPIAWLLVGRQAQFGFASITLGLGGLTFLRNHDYRSALAMWEDTVAKYPTNARAHQHLAIELERLGGPTSQIISHYEAALRVHPNFAEVHNNLANQISTIPGRLPEAIAHYEEAIRLKPDFALAHFNLGAQLAKIPMRSTDAIQHYEAAIRIDPNYAEAHNNLSVELGKIPARAEEALTHARIAVRLSPNLSQAHFNLANGLAGVAGHRREAIEHFERAIQIAPDFVDARNNLAVAYGEEGRIADAKVQLEAILKIAPNHSEALANLSKIRAFESQQAAQTNHP